MKILTYLCEDPIDIREVMNFLRVDDETEFEQVRNAVHFAYSHIRHFCNFFVQKAKIEFEAKPREKIYLPCAPVKSVDKVIFKTSDGTMIEVGLNNYELTRESGFYIVQLKNFEIPVDAEKEIIQFTCGYDNDDFIPGIVKHAVFILAADFYEIRQGKLPERVYDAFDISSVLETIKVHYDGDLNA